MHDTDIFGKILRLNNKEKLDTTWILTLRLSDRAHSGADQRFLCMLELMLQYHSSALYKNQNKLPALKSPFLRTEIYFSHLEQNPAKLSVI